MHGGFASGDYGYFVPHFNTGEFFGKLVRVDLETFSQVQVLDLAATDTDLKGFEGGYASGDYGYLVPYNNYDPHGNGTKTSDDAYFGKVVRIDLLEGSLSLLIRFLILPSFTPLISNHPIPSPRYPLSPSLSAWLRRWLRL